jgi:uncharacterized low-complexity protein
LATSFNPTGTISMKKTLTLGSAFLASATLALSAHAGESFSSNSLSQGYQLASADGKASEAACGGKGHEGQCGAAGMKAKEGKCGASKAEHAKCGASKAKAKKAKKPAKAASKASA